MKNIEGNYYDKHGSSNTIVKKLMANFHKILNRFISKTKVKTILDVGCGEGHTTKLIKDKHKDVFIEGIELGKGLVKQAQKTYPDVHFEDGSIYEIKREDNSYDMTLSTEVLEHLEYPLKGLKELRRVSKRFVLITVPNEPWWRIMNMVRLSYLKNWGNTPGHLNHWTKKGLMSFLKHHFKKVIVKNALLWNVALCVKQ